MLLPRDRKGLERDEMLPDDRTGYHVGFPEMGLAGTRLEGREAEDAGELLAPGQEDG